MPSNDGFESLAFDDPSPFDQPVSDHPPWPHFQPRQQALIEKTFFEEGATIHFERLPSLQFWAPLFLVKDSVRVTFIATKVVSSSKVARRRLTAEEVDGTSEAAATCFRYIPWIQPLSMAAAFAVTWKKRRTFSFPFYRPTPRKFNPFVFPSRWMPILKGRRAFYAWHTCRYTSYFLPILVVNLIFFTSLTETTYQARVVRDPRLKNMVLDIRRNSGQSLQQGNSMQRPSPPPSRAQYPSQSENHGTRDYGRGTYTGQSENGFTESATRPYRSAAASAPQASPSKPQYVRHPQSDSQNADYDDDLFDSDDASPVSAASRRSEAQQARESQSGSAWDRIRRQAQSGNAQWARGDSSGQERGWSQLRQDKTRNPREVQPKTESFAYTEQEEYNENRNYEKEQAQKEFDALLEAERRGGSNRE
ncbi:hypothetical protein F5Y13DRAFT_74291 [Hypoxylon sp. FL1857]|nr:hypothetical protein F5Y13DRAFT_74291 [Hypoxylon sp. FL1857]